ncbi:MAG: arsenic resistance N-acetyltransferase ArsN2 [Ignavibacteria bacterium]|nr:arsenic resistance N-acetyltransferase ArsN2 [Ignavibacteria bacterium]
MEISYREAKPTETDAIRSLLEKSELPTESLGKNTTEFFIAESVGGIVGIAGFEFYGSDALLRSVAIPADLQNKGIGSGMVDWMLAQAKTRGTRRIVLLTDTAQKFFERKGFEVTDRSAIRNEAMTSSSEFTDACPVSAVCMILHLQ